MELIVVEIDEKELFEGAPEEAARKIYTCLKESLK